MRVLIIEDDPLLQQGMLLAMQSENYLCDAVNGIKGAEQFLETSSYSLLLLDLGLPDGDGLTFLKRLRRQKNTLPTIILTARDTLEDRIVGLDSGADDYLIKPFALEELLARSRALIRRFHQQSDNRLEVDDLTIDIGHRQAFLAEQLLELTPKEYAILLRLMLKVNQPVHRDVLYSDIYSWDNEPSTNSLEVHIHNLRDKIGKQRIQTLRGFGYSIRTQEIL
ncbi:two-component system response regulator PmrA [Tatumella ptyseos]|uniref:two-component system response regulator PmrA n=1 Tax=Tatumella ptyseos TaxID=82987 RepID=UPI0026F13050|nr:two-component system response regulator PmrA [Tatumella ptyseos]WKX27889.1 two-component system response regulator PmrA [Tatumella ptyseos]